MAKKYNQGVADANRRRTKHGGTTNQREGAHDPVYTAWTSMKDRCGNPATRHYARYGGRGIKVCAAWVEDFAAFRDHLGPRPHGYSLERINNEGDYEPNNVRWASKKEQANNRTTNILITMEGKTLTMKQWGELLGISYHVLRGRRAEGISGEALLAPAHFVKGALIEHEGRSMTLPDWSKETGIGYQTLYWRVKHGKPLLGKTKA